MSVDASPLEALFRFEVDPGGALHWLAQQKAGQASYLIERWVRVIQAEARQGYDGSYRSGTPHEDEAQGKRVLQ